jgi:hypothetical protein
VFDESTEEDESAVFNTNVNGLVRMTRLCLPHIRDGGHIVNMGSVAGRQAYEKGASYVASKFAVRGFLPRRGPARAADPDHDRRRRPRRGTEFSIVRALNKMREQADAPA